ncbi:guanine nucleotide-binding protein subunit gamma 1 [Iris pallida]|uniref:Guanine nucleotide-binding protein subunit gamma 1 n=1 Tax=Iris pallida TaxID=29817 RepID=A0AAX6HTS8_IRIPA|nr:guanine nucleotide-binding protein subunit gamma 1 [Iris pallida]
MLSLLPNSYNLLTTTLSHPLHIGPTGSHHHSHPPPPPPPPPLAIWAPSDPTISSPPPIEVRHVSDCRGVVKFGCRYSKALLKIASAYFMLFYMNTL